MTKQELNALKNQFIQKEAAANDKEKAMRKQIFKVTKRYMKMLGIIEKLMTGAEES